MKSSYPMARKQYSRTVALMVCAAVVVANIRVYIASKCLTVPTYSVLFLATFDPDVHPLPQRQTGVGNPSGSRYRSSELAGLTPLRRADDVAPRKLYNYSGDERLFLDAIEASREPPPVAAVPRIAFLFLVRDEIPFEPLWRRYFAEQDGRYSIYVHANPNFTFPRSSFFFRKEIPSRSVVRLSRSLADATRRLFAMALLDWQSNNMWFVNVCEKTIPLWSFHYTYEYLMGSHHSFVQAFQPVPRYARALPHFAPEEVRKGEVWMALNRKYTITLVGDRDIYNIFVQECHKLCYFDERYFQTMLNLQDPGGIANRTVMFVDWSGEHQSSPRTWDAQTTNASSLHMIASLTEDSIYGQHHDTAFQPKETLQCAYNGVPGAACFLFARKFDPSALPAAKAWLSHIQRLETQLPTSY